MHANLHKFKKKNIKAEKKQVGYKYMVILIDMNTRRSNVVPQDLKIKLWDTRKI